MTITFADGLRMEISESALDDFVKHDLQWVEFVHGRAAAKTTAQDSPRCSAAAQKRRLADPQTQNVHHCPAC